MLLEKFSHIGNLNAHIASVHERIKPYWCEISDYRKINAEKVTLDFKFCET